jgi:hypothetical protein
MAAVAALAMLTAALWLRPVDFPFWEDERRTVGSP